jgi:hypothetical protein
MNQYSLGKHKNIHFLYFIFAELDSNDYEEVAIVVLCLTDSLIVFGGATWSVLNYVFLHKLKYKYSKHLHSRLSSPK